MGEIEHFVAFDERAVVAGPDAPLPAGGKVNHVTFDKFPIYRIEPLLNGDQILPAMIAAIRSATNSVNLESYLWMSGRMSDAFIEALGERELIL